MLCSAVHHPSSVALAFVLSAARDGYLLILDAAAPGPADGLPEIGAERFGYRLYRMEDTEEHGDRHIPTPEARPESYLDPAAAYDRAHESAARAAQAGAGIARQLAETRQRFPSYTFYRDGANAIARSETGEGYVPVYDHPGSGYNWGRIHYGELAEQAEITEYEAARDYPALYHRMLLDAEDVSPATVEAYARASGVFA